MRSNAPSSRAATNASFVSTATTSTGRPALASRARPSSTSARSSSRNRVLIIGPLASLMAAFLSLPAIAPGRRLVDDGPEETDLLEGGHELGEVDRLDHVGVHAQLVALLEIGRLGGRSQDHHWNRLQILVGLDLPEHIQAVHLGELQVEEN